MGRVIYLGQEPEEMKLYSQRFTSSGGRQGLGVIYLVAAVPNVYRVEVEWLDEPAQQWGFWATNSPNERISASFHSYREALAELPRVIRSAS